MAPSDISLVLLTQGHVDHFGSAAELRERTGAPVAVHERDIDALRRGTNPLSPNRLRARMIWPFLKHNAPPVEPDLVFTGGWDLAEFGVAGHVFETPGHTPGSVSIALDAGEIIVGDVLMGGHVGGRLRPRTPREPYFTDGTAAKSEKGMLGRVRPPRSATLGRFRARRPRGCRRWGTAATAAYGPPEGSGLGEA